MYTFEVSRIFGPPEALVQADGILAEVSSFAPQISSLDHCLSHHLLLSWLTPHPFRMQARFGAPESARRLREFGNLAFIPAAVPTSCRYQTDVEPHRVVALRVAPHLLEQIGEEVRIPDPGALASCNLQEPDILDGMRQLARETLAPGFASALLVESLGTALLVRLARRLGQPARQERRGGLAAWQMRRITERMADGGAGVAIPTLAELAGLAGISASHLRRAFKQSTGYTLGEYIRQVQFDRACDLLAKTNLSLQEIATRLGFAAPYGFTVAFRRGAGVTPSAYRQQMRAHCRT
ncbi:MAG: helix-turn-helix transcriptional regulator [Rhodocyclaceae bacterium]|jgi:AraC family transcriptional regulator|nr:helix-turn-helix transcriptional regulator [Rhodocyclaceae bacterium]